MSSHESRFIEHGDSLLGPYRHSAGCDALPGSARHLKPLPQSHDVMTQHHFYILSAALQVHLNFTDHSIYSFQPNHLFQPNYSMSDSTTNAADKIGANVNTNAIPKSVRCHASPT